MNAPPTPNMLISELKKQVFQLTTKEWSPDVDSKTFLEITKAFQCLVKKLGIDEDTYYAKYYDNIELHSFIKHYFHHENWKVRVCGLIFWDVFTLAQDEDPLWALLDDPEIRTVEYLLRLTKEWEFDLEMHRDASQWKYAFRNELGWLTDETLRSLNLSLLLQRLPEINSEVRLSYFERVLTIIARRIYLGNMPQQRSMLLQLIETALVKDFKQKAIEEMELWDLWYPNLLEGLLGLWVKSPHSANDLEWGETALKLLEGLDRETHLTRRELDEVVAVLSNVGNVALLQQVLPFWGNEDDNIHYYAEQLSCDNNLLPLWVQANTRRAFNVTRCMEYIPQLQGEVQAKYVWFLIEVIGNLLTLQKRNKQLIHQLVTLIKDHLLADSVVRTHTKEHPVW